MKNTIKHATLLFTGLLMIAFLSSFAGNKPFQGVMTYKITYPNSSFDASVLTQLPKVLNVYYGENHVKTVMSMGEGTIQNIVSLTDQSVITLIDVMGQKFAVKSSKEEVEEDAGDVETNIEYLNETKEIAGYDCKKALVHVKLLKTGTEFTSTVFYTEDIITPNAKSLDPIFKDMKGTLMEYEMQEQGLTMKFNVTSVKKKKLSEDDFVIPSDYTETTKEELQNSFGGGM